MTETEVSEFFAFLLLDDDGIVLFASAYDQPWERAVAYMEMFQGEMWAHAAEVVKEFYPTYQQAWDRAVEWIKQYDPVFNDGSNPLGEPPPPEAFKEE